MNCAPSRQAGAAEDSICTLWGLAVGIHNDLRALLRAGGNLPAETLEQESVLSAYLAAAKEQLEASPSPQNIQT